MPEKIKLVLKIDDTNNPVQLNVKENQFRMAYFYPHESIQADDLSSNDKSCSKI